MAEGGTVTCYITQITQEDEREPLMSVRTREHWLIGWYFPAGLGGFIAERFQPPHYQRQAHQGPFPSEWDAVQWITARP